MSPNEINHKVPEWLNKTFLKECLQRKYNDKKIEIVDFNVKPGTNKGDNYCSIIHRVKVKYIEYGEGNNEQNPIETIQSLIIKATLDDEVAVASLNHINFYSKEIEMYDEIIPKMKILLEKLGIEDQLFADTFFVDKSKVVIVFEDLLVKDYAIKRTKEGYDLTHAKAIIRKLAQLHGVGAKLQEQEPNIFKNFSNSQFTSDSDAFSIMYLKMLDLLVELVSTWPNYEIIANKLRKFRSKFIEKGRQLFDPNDNQFNTLTHGDPWTNNIMLKYDEKSNLENVILVDLQVACWTSSTLDVLYVINTSLEDDLVLNRENGLLEYYYEQLVPILKQLNYQKHIPTLDELRSQLIEKSVYAFYVACFIRAVTMNEDCHDADMDCLIKDDERAREYKRMLYQSPRIQKIARKLLPYFDQLGLFD